jgi:hypothetical protein
MQAVVLAMSGTTFPHRRIASGVHVRCLLDRRCAVASIFNLGRSGRGTPKIARLLARNAPSQILWAIPRTLCSTKLMSTKVLASSSQTAKSMADWYPLMSDAIAALDKKTGEARRAFYHRARASLANSLRKADPPLSETTIEHERLALEDAISKVEAGAIFNDGTLIDHAEDYIRSAALEASWAQVDAKVQTRRERRLAFWGFLIVAAVWIGDLFYKPPTFSGWFNWLRLGGFIFFPTMAILSYFIMRENWSVEEEERAYIVFTPIILGGAVLASVALYWAFGRLAATPS